MQRRVWLILVPFLVAAHFAMPGSLGALRAAFGNEKASDQGRTSDYGPSFAEMNDNPLGVGYGTRVVTGPGANARILDNQWLASGVETGVLGVVALAWLVGRLLRRLGTASKEVAGSESWLLAALTASIAAFAAGMFTFDSFSFIQVACVFFMVVGGLFALMSLAGVSLPMEHEGAPPAWIGPVLGAGAIVVLPLFYGVMGILAGAVSAALFNVFARLTGGLEVELE